MSVWSSLGFPDAVSPLMEEMLFFHDSVMALLCGITVFVGVVMVGSMMSCLTNTGLLEGQTVEFIWTVLPAVVLVFIGLPSLRLLYALDEASDAALTLKAVGHQWYWSYEYSGFPDLSFDSYMLPAGEGEGQFRLLDVDNRVVLPIHTAIRVLVTATDVIHSWTVPTLGVKVDGVPGRLNQLSMVLGRPGLFMGQCSEICGANHSFMPIMVEGVSESSFLTWLESA